MINSGRSTAYFAQQPSCQGRTKPVNAFFSGVKFCSVTPPWTLLHTGPFFFFFRHEGYLGKRTVPVRIELPPVSFANSSRSFNRSYLLGSDASQVEYHVSVPSYLQWFCLKRGPDSDSSQSTGKVGQIMIWKQGFPMGRRLGVGFPHM